MMPWIAIARRIQLIVLVLFTLAGLSGCIGLDDPTREIVQRVINELNRQPHAWQNTLTNAIDELGRVTTKTAHTVLADLQSVYNGAIGQTESAALCGADFVGHRISQKVQAILHSIDPSKAAPTIVPVVCTTNPGTHIEPGATQSVSYYGYDFLEFSKSGKFSVDLQYASGQVVQRDFGFVAIAHNYELTVDIQMTRQRRMVYRSLDKNKGPQLILRWQGKQVLHEKGQSVLPIIFAAPPRPTPAPPAHSNLFKIEVTTGNISEAGTDAKAYIQLFGDIARSDEIKLDLPNYDDRQRGKTDTYNLALNNDLGNLTKIRIWHDNSEPIISGEGPGWFLERVLVTNLDTGKTWRFNTHRWLAKDKGGIDVVFSPN